MHIVKEPDLSGHFRCLRKTVFVICMHIVKEPDTMFILRHQCKVVYKKRQVVGEWLSGRRNRRVVAFGNVEANF